VLNDLWGELAEEPAAPARPRSLARRVGPAVLLAGLVVVAAGSLWAVHKSNGKATAGLAARPPDVSEPRPPDASPAPKARDAESAVPAPAVQTAEPAGVSPPGRTQVAVTGDRKEPASANPQATEPAPVRPAPAQPPAMEPAPPRPAPAQPQAMEPVRPAQPPAMEPAPPRPATTEGSRSRRPARVQAHIQPPDAGAVRASGLGLAGAGASRETTADPGPTSSDHSPRRRTDDPEILDPGSIIDWLLQDSRAGRP
jgi:hypothetical protein